MSRVNDLTFLPSKVIMTNGDVVDFDSISTKDKARIRRTMCNSAGERLRAYYSTNRSEWEAFVNIMA